MNELDKKYDPLKVDVKGENANFIGIKRDLIYTKQGDQIVNNKEILILVALCSMNVKNRHELYTTPREIYYVLTGKLYIESEERRFMNDTIIKTLTNLIAKKKIKVIDGLEDTEKIKVNTPLLLDVSSLLRAGKETFVAIDERELHRIMNVNKTFSTSISREKLLSLFMSVIASISVHEIDALFCQLYESTKSYQGLVCYKPYERLSEITGLSQRTISEYFEMLEKMKLLYKYSFDEYVQFDDEGNPRNLNNWYARYQFKDQVDELANLWLSQIDYAYKRKNIESDDDKNNIPYWGEERKF